MHYDLFHRGSRRLARDAIPVSTHALSADAATQHAAKRPKAAPSELSGIPWRPMFKFQFARTTDPLSGPPMPPPRALFDAHSQGFGDELRPVWAAMHGWLAGDMAGAAKALLPAYR